MAIYEEVSASIASFDGGGMVYHHKEFEALEQ